MPAPFQAIIPSPDSDCRRCTPDILAVVAHLHSGNVNDRRVLPAFRTRSPREFSLKAGLRVGQVHSPFCAGFSNRSMYRWTSDSRRPNSPSLIRTAQRVPSRTKRRSDPSGMPRRLAAWLQVKILSAGSVVSGGGKLLPPSALGRPAGFGPARQPGSFRRISSILGALVRKSKPSVLLRRLVLAESRRAVPWSCSSIVVKTAANVVRRQNKPR